MSTGTMRARPILMMWLVLGVIGCWVGVGRGPYYPYSYPWYYSSYGAYSVVRRPVVVVDGWTNRAFGFRPYGGYVVRRHASSPIVYTAARSDDTLQVDLTAMGDSTRVEVRARDKERARDLLGMILKDYK